MTFDAAKTSAAQKRAAKQQRLKARERFVRARKAEKGFQRQLLQVAKQVGSIVKGFAPEGVVNDLSQLTNALSRYSDLIRPWAKAVSATMTAEVGQRDEQAWTSMGRELGRNLRQEIENAPTGQVMQLLMAEQVDLITSLPTKAAQRVHHLTIEALSDSTRASEIAKEIQRTEQVTASRAKLIARTETSRAVGAMTQSRAEYIGSPGYIWRTAGDSDVREIHKHLEGHIIAWDDPPVAGENGERAHAGMIYNCRCYMEPLVPDIID